MTIADDKAAYEAMCTRMAGATLGPDPVPTYAQYLEQQRELERFADLAKAADPRCKECHGYGYLPIIRSTGPPACVCTTRPGR